MHKSNLYKTENRNTTWAISEITSPSRLKTATCRAQQVSGIAWRLGNANIY